MANDLDMNRIPQHIAIIMDGNGRWATERGKERSFGHQAGVETVRRITSECTRLGVSISHSILSLPRTGTVRLTRWQHSWDLFLLRLRTRSL